MVPVRPSGRELAADGPPTATQVHVSPTAFGTPPVASCLLGLVDFEAAGVIGADRCGRSEDRIAERNGKRPKLLANEAGDIELRIPKLRQRSFSPSIH